MLFPPLLVIFFFLHSVRATIIASLAVPISLIGPVGTLLALSVLLGSTVLRTIMKVDFIQQDDQGEFREVLTAVLAAVLTE